MSCACRSDPAHLQSMPCAVLSAHFDKADGEHSADMRALRCAALCLLLCCAVAAWGLQVALPSVTCMCAGQSAVCHA